MFLNNPKQGKVFSWSSEQSRQDMTVIRPRLLTQLMGRRPLSQLHTIDNWDPRTSLQDMQAGSMAGILLHEMAHSPYMLGQNTYLGNDSLPILSAILRINCH